MNLTEFQNVINRLMAIDGMGDFAVKIYNPVTSIDEEVTGLIISWNTDGQYVTVTDACQYHYEVDDLHGFQKTQDESKYINDEELKSFPQDRSFKFIAAHGCYDSDE